MRKILNSLADTEPTGIITSLVVNGGNGYGGALPQSGIPRPRSRHDVGRRRTETGPQLPRMEAALVVDPQRLQHLFVGWLIGADVAVSGDENEDSDGH